MKLLISLLSLSFLTSCALLKPSGTADYDSDGIVTDEEYKRFNKEQDELSVKIANESIKKDEGFKWSSLNPF